MKRLISALLVSVSLFSMEEHALVKSVGVQTDPQAALPVLERLLQSQGVGVCPYECAHEFNQDSIRLWSGPCPACGSHRVDEQALMDAAGFGDLAEVKRLILEKNYDPNLVDECGNAVLIYAANRGDGEVIKFLLDQNANPNVKDRVGCVPLICAAYQGKKDAVDIFLPVTNIEECIEDTNYKIAIAIAETGGHKDIADMLRKPEKQLRLKKLVDSLNSMEDNPMITKWRAWKSKQG